MGDCVRKSIDDHNLLPGTWSFKCKGNLIGNQEIQGTIFYERGFPEETMS